MAADYAWDTDHFIICNGTSGSPRNFAALNDWAQAEGGAAAAITEIVEDRMYKLDADVEFGDGTESTYFTSVLEQVLFADGEIFQVKANATLQLGELVGDWGVKGSSFSFSYTSTYQLVTTDGELKLYDSKLVNTQTTDSINMQFVGTSDMRNSVLGGNSTNPGVQWRYDRSTNQLRRMYINNSKLGLFALQSMTAVVNLHTHNCRTPLSINADSTFDKILMTSISSNVINTWEFDTDVVIKDPLENMAGPFSIGQSGTIKEQYTCNIHVTDKDGNDLEDVTVTCTDSQPVEEFSVDTDSNGDIAEQTIDFKTWTGTDETLTSHSPHVFTFVKDGYKTLTITGYTVDHPIVWELKLLDAGAFSNYAEDMVLEHITGKTEFTKSTVYVGLCTSDPGEAATGASCNELPDSDGYARVAIPPANWNAASGGEITNSAAVTFPEASGNWGEVTHYVLLDSGTHGAGNVITYDRLDQMIDIRDEETIRFVAGNLKLTLD